MKINPATNRQRQRDVIHVSKMFREKILRGEMESCSVVEKTAETLGISRSTVLRYWKIDPDFFTTPNKMRRRGPVVRCLDDFGKGVVQRITYGMYDRGEPVTIDSLLAAVRQAEEAGFTGGRTSLYKLFPQLGFQWQRTDARPALLGNSHVSACRVAFLRDYKTFQEQGYSFIFLDETWFYSKGFSPKTWQDGSSSTMKRKSLDKGKRYVVVHAGGKDGFVEGALLVFSSKEQDGDYHKTFNGPIFENWLTNQLLPSLPSPSVVVLDNASYHSVQCVKSPTSRWTKAEFVSWLQDNGISVPNKISRNKAKVMAMQHKSRKTFKADQLILQSGHQVLRLPPYHCQYNPIELAWSDCKRYYEKHAGRGNRFDEEAVLAIWEEAVAQVSPQKWAKYVGHTESLITKDREQALKTHSRFDVHPVIVDLQSSDSEDEPLAVPLE